MEKKKTKKKWREIRSAITMMCVMLAMLSTATYAWFTLSGSPVVNGLQMTAASTGGLKISKNYQNWYNAIDMAIKGSDGVEAVASRTIYPATLETKEIDSLVDISTYKVPAFKLPVYEGLSVTSVDAIEDEDTLKQYVAQCRYYLLNEKTTEASVGILTAPMDTLQSKIDDLENKDITVTADGNPNIEGSFVTLIDQPDNDTPDNSAIESVRVAFVISGQADDETVIQKVIVWEPNNGTTTLSGMTQAINALGNGAGTSVTPDVVSKHDDGVITVGGYENSTTGRKSAELFTIPAGEYVTVDMYAWFEGQDSQCVDQIMQDQIEVQVQFTDLAYGTNDSQ